MAKKSTTTREGRRALFRAMIADLQKERSDLLARLSAIEAELGEYGSIGAAPSRPRAKAKATARKGVRGRRAGAAKKTIARTTKKRAAKKVAKKTAQRRTKSGARAPRDGSLKAFVIAALGRKPMAPAQISEAVTAAGYKSTSKHLPQRVAVACSELVHSGQIGKKGRGKYVSA